MPSDNDFDAYVAGVRARAKTAIAEAREEAEAIVAEAKKDVERLVEWLQSRCEETTAKVETPPEPQAPGTGEHSPGQETL